MTAPDISVVMSLYNNESSLKKTIDSILSQQGVQLEFIIINDGSIDDSTAIIEPYFSSDPRVKLISHDNIGLTKSLIIGCELAQGRYIARQDAGDISLPNRLAEQFNVLENKPTTAMVSSATDFVTPNDEHLYTTRQSSNDARDGLKELDAKKLQGPPHHGSVMFRKSIYDQVGGYRKEFSVAQDIDLWTRLVEYGEHESLNNVLYQATVERNSISSTKRQQQFKTATFIVECIKARTLDMSEKEILEKLHRYNLSVSNVTQNSRVSNSNYYYFLGSSLINKHPTASKRYFINAIIENPFNWRALIKFMRLVIKYN